MSSLQRLLVAVTAMFIAVPAAVPAKAEPCILAYPGSQTMFRYDPDRYEVLAPSDADFNPNYSLSGQMLWDKVEGRVAYEVYQAPGLSGFEPSTSGRSEFHQVASRGTLVIDGFSVSPRQLSDVCVQFNPRPGTAPVSVKVNGVPVSGLRYMIPHFAVSTPTPDGFYSDQIVLTFEWSGALQMEVIVYSDRNRNRVFDGEMGFSVLLEERTVPTRSATWGGIKAIYGE
jgi:hypothetical protein